QLDGKFVVHSNDDSLTPADLALGYKQLQRVEEAWRTLKSGLRVRPVYHWAVHRIHAHVALSVLALLLERVIEQACGDTWRNIRDDLEQIKLAQLLSPHGEVWQVPKPAPEVNVRAPHHSHLPIRKKVLSKKSWYNIAHGKYSATTHLHLGVCTGQRQERHALFPTDSGADEAGLYQAQVGGQLLAGTTRVPGATRSGHEGTSRNA